MILEMALITVEVETADKVPMVGHTLLECLMSTIGKSGFMVAQESRIVETAGIAAARTYQGYENSGLGA